MDLEQQLKQLQLILGWKEEEVDNAMASKEQVQTQLVESESCCQAATEQVFKLQIEMESLSVALHAAENLTAYASKSTEGSNTLEEGATHNHTTNLDEQLFLKKHRHDISTIRSLSKRLLVVEILLLSSTPNTSSHHVPIFDGAHNNSYMMFSAR